MAYIASLEQQYNERISKRDFFKNLNFDFLEYKLRIAINSHEINLVLPLLQYVNSKFIIEFKQENPHVRMGYHRKYYILTYVATFGNSKILQALFDVNIKTTPFNCGFDEDDDNERNLLKSYGCPYCKTIVDTIVNCLHIASDVYMKASEYKKIKYSHEFTEMFFLDRVKMLHIALENGHQGTYVSLGSIVSYTTKESAFRDIPKSIFIKMAALIFYYRVRVDEEASMTYVDFFERNKREGISTSNIISKMVMLYEKHWDTLILLYCFEEKGLSYFY
jgi:hypothetical protein